MDGQKGIIQHSFGSFGSFGHSNQSRKRNKRNPNWKSMYYFIHEKIMAHNFFKFIKCLEPKYKNPVPICNYFVLFPPYRKDMGEKRVYFSNPIWTSEPKTTF